MTARDLLRERFPANEGWTILLDNPVDGTAHASATHHGPNDFVSRVTVFAYSTKGVYNTDSAVENALAAWEAVTHAKKLRKAVDALEELITVAALRGDDVLPHPADDSVSWTARMQTAWEEARAALAALPEHWKEGVRDK